MDYFSLMWNIAFLAYLWFYLNILKSIILFDNPKNSLIVFVDPMQSSVKNN